MKKTKPYFTKDETEIVSFIRVLWKERILILFITTVCVLLAHLYGFLQTKEFKTVLSIKYPNILLFNSYSEEAQPDNNTNFTNSQSKSSYFTNSQSKSSYDIKEIFIFNLNSNLFSLQNINDFIIQNKEYDNFQKFLNSKNISANQYFSSNRIGAVKEENKFISNKYFLIFPEELDGANFFNNYYKFIKNKTIEELKKDLKYVYEGNIYKYENDLKTFGNYKMTDDKKISKSNNNFYNENNMEILVLNNKINRLKALIKKLENENFNYDHVVNEASTVYLTSKTADFFLINGLLLGLFISLIIIFIKK